MPASLQHPALELTRIGVLQTKVGNQGDDRRGQAVHTGLQKETRLGGGQQSGTGKEKGNDAINFAGG